MPIDAARFWAKVSVVEEGPLGCWPWLEALARPDGRALAHDPDLGRPTQAARNRLAAQPRSAAHTGRRSTPSSVAIAPRPHRWLATQ